MNKYNFDGLFILDMANNHQGDLDHGMSIISRFGQAIRDSHERAAIKFQFRRLDTFIHPDFRERENVKHIPRFLSTRIRISDYALMTDAVRDNQMTTMCTPFDEESVDDIIELGIEIIKVASCSADDRPLLDKISTAGKPVIASTAGLSMHKIDRLVSFFTHKGVDFALMHCVAIYPTPQDNLELNQINILRDRFPNITIGFSTHETPDNYNAVQIAYAKGARIFERHVGLEERGHKLNAYSSNPEQIRKWLDSHREAVDMCGSERRAPSSIEETASLRSLMRGVYCREHIIGETSIKRENVFFAMPLLESQLRAADWTDGIIADTDYAPHEPLKETIKDHSTSDDELIYQIMLQVKGMLNNARIFIGKNKSVELSHHYGLKRFREFGAVIISCINRAYCKKIVIQLPRQKHPYHFHKKKEETFQVLSGDLEIELDGRRYSLEPGDTCLVKPHQWHKFHSLHGTVFEEISTTHYNDDSFYEDEEIARLPRQSRKTVIASWDDAIKSRI